MRRWIIQFFFLAVHHPFIQNFLTGTIYRGPTKMICTGTLTCYSCPAAPFSCPIGTMQYLIEYAKMIPTYAIGSLAVFGTLFGRGPCAYACPFGLLQDILHKLSPFSAHRRIIPSLRHLKWLVFGALVVIVPLWQEIPAFCAWFCPAGTLQAGIPIVIANESFRSGIGLTFAWKVFLLVVILLGAMREHRPFCRYLCPLGLFLGLFNRISMIQITRDHKKCLVCRECGKQCPMGLSLPDEINHLDCIKCGSCVRGCPPKVKALLWRFAPLEAEVTSAPEKSAKTQN